MLLVAIALLGGCDGGRSADSRLVQGDQTVGGYRDSGGDEKGRQVAHIVTAPRGDREAARFELVTGVTTITVRIADLGDQLYRIATPDGSRVAPSARDSAEGVALSLIETGLTGPAAVEVLLNRDLRWHVRLAGGSQEQILDLSAGPISVVELLAGATRIQLTLPARITGTTSVRMSGGASLFGVTAPLDVPVRVRLDSGAGNAVVDGTSRSGLPAGAVLQPPDWAQAVGKYDIQAQAGVSTFTLDRR